MSNYDSIKEDLLLNLNTKLLSYSKIYDPILKHKNIIKTGKKYNSLESLIRMLANSVEEVYGKTHRALNQGNCGIFALALYRWFGKGDIGVICPEDKPNSFVHCFWISEDGKFFDFRGIQSLDSMKAFYGVGRNKNLVFKKGYKDKEDIIKAGTRDDLTVEQVLACFARYF